MTDDKDARIDALEMELEAANRDAEACDLFFVCVEEAINELRAVLRRNAAGGLDTNAQWALDPAISSDAAHLRDTHLHRAETAERALEATKRDAEMWQDRAERCGVAMALFAAAIKGGEPWSAECQRALDAARKEQP